MNVYFGNFTNNYMAKITEKKLKLIVKIIYTTKKAKKQIRSNGQSDRTTKK